MKLGRIILSKYVVYCGYSLFLPILVPRSKEVYYYLNGRGRGKRLFIRSRVTSVQLPRKADCRHHWLNALPFLQ